MEFGTGIHGPQRRNAIDFIDPRTFYIWCASEMSQQILDGLQCDWVSPDNIEMCPVLWFMMQN